MPTTATGECIVHHDTNRSLTDLKYCNMNVLCPTAECLFSIPIRLLLHKYLIMTMMIIVPRSLLISFTQYNTP